MSPPEITRGLASLCARVFSNTKTRNQLKALLITPPVASDRLSRERDAQFQCGGD